MKPSSLLRTLPRAQRLQHALLLAGVLSLTACANFSGISPHAQALTAEQLNLQGSTKTEISAQWWESFGDAQLNRLVADALANSPSLRVAQTRLERVQAAQDSLRGSEGPQLNASLDMTRQLFSATSIYPPPLGGSVRNIGTLQFTGSWEMDFFGKNRAALNAALGQEQAALADAQAARMLLASSVARTYFQLVRIEAQLGIAKRTLAQREQNRNLVQDRVTAGLDTQLELQQSAGALPEARLQIEILQEQKQLALNALAALTSKPNTAMALDIPAQTAIKSVALSTNMPMDLLARRPDIAAAKQRVRAASSEIDVAKAQFYPNINLVAFTGLSAIGFDKLTDAGSEQWGVGPAIRLPLFDGGRLRANLRSRTADLDAAVESYNSVVIDAVHDVADQIASTQAIQKQQAEQAQAQANAETAYSIATQRYQAGLGTYLHVLAAETAVLAQRRQAADLQARVLDTQVQLMRALGGGYQDTSATLAQR
jgi:NodT family efflux transporter outer membrane factor (OMF) lipoprotein